MALNIPPHLTGLSSNEVLASQKQYGFNKVHVTENSSWIML
jgi:Ca2+-transporting ATPase